MLTVAPATALDVRAIADLVEEAELFHGGVVTEPLDTRMQQVSAMLFREHPAAYVLLAKDGGRAVGFAAYSFLWPASGLTQSLFLKELFVSAASRRGGVGKALMDRVMEIAEETECNRVEWTTGRDNAVAIAFYERHGYPTNPAKIMYRVGLGR